MLSPAAGTAVTQESKPVMRKATTEAQLVFMVASYRRELLVLGLSRSMDEVKTGMLGIEDVVKVGRKSQVCAKR